MPLKLVRIVYAEAERQTVTQILAVERDAACFFACTAFPRRMKRNAVIDGFAFADTALCFAGFLLCCADIAFRDDLLVKAGRRAGDGANGIVKAMRSMVVQPAFVIQRKRHAADGKLLRAYKRLVTDIIRAVAIILEIPLDERIPASGRL